MEQKQQALHTHVQHLAAQGERQIAVAGLVTNVDAFCERIQYGLATATFEQKRALVELLVDRVVVTDEQVEIRYVIPMSPTSEQVRFCHLRTDYFRRPHVVACSMLAHCKPAVHEMGRNRMRMLRVGRAAGAAWPLGLETCRPHEPFHALAATADPLRAQLGMHPWAAVCATTALMDHVNSRAVGAGRSALAG